MANSKPRRNAKSLHNAPLYRAFSLKNHPLDFTKTQYIEQLFYSRHTVPQIVFHTVTQRGHEPNTCGAIGAHQIDVRAKSAGAAAGEAMAGQVVECYRQCRGMLENAAYAVHIHRDPSLATVWLNRHQDEAGMKASKKAFQHIAVTASVAAANQHAGKRFEDLYQRTIDWGGHPNERSVTGNMKMIEEPDRRVMLAIMLHGDGVQLDMALKTVAQCGMVSLELLQVLYNAKFEILGINAAMLDLRKGL
jgi:hypothetical protein